MQLHLSSTENQEFIAMGEVTRQLKVGQWSISHYHVASMLILYYLCLCSVRDGSTSYSMVVLYIRDHAVLGVLTQEYHPKTSLKFTS